MEPAAAARLDRARQGGRSWPFAASLVLFVAFLGLVPHARFSRLIDETSYFFSAYDEDTYSLWAFSGGGPRLLHRWLSSTVLLALAKVSGGSWERAMVLADVIFPAACALLAWRLVGRLTGRRLLRLVLALGLLFAQELLSLGCWTIWQFSDLMGVPTHDSPRYDLRWFRSLAPPWASLLWPDYASPFLSLFRTPEPEISRVLGLAILTMLLDLCAAPAEASPRRRAPFLVLGALAHLLFAVTYLFQAAALVVFEALLSGALLWCGRRRAALVAGAFALIGALSTLVGVLAYGLGSSGPGRSFAFPSHLPVVTPASIVALLGFLALVTIGRRPQEALFPFALVSFATVLVLTNQQVLTGWMISARDWERFVDYPLVLLGVAVVGRWWLRRARIRLPTMYAFAGALLLAGSAVLVKAQDRVFEEEFLVVNLKSVALKRAVETVEARGLRGATWLLEDPELEPMLQVRLGRRIDHLLDFGEVFRRPVDPLARSNGAWGPRSPYAREVFEYFARRPRTPAAVARILRGETDGGTGHFIWFLFDLTDYWSAITDGRRTRRDEVREHLGEIHDAYVQYLRTGDPCWARPVVVLTRQTMPQRVSERWEESFLVEVTVGRGSALMNMHAYLQEVSPRYAPAASGGCD